MVKKIILTVIYLFSVTFAIPLVLSLVFNIFGLLTSDNFGDIGSFLLSAISFSIYLVLFIIAFFNQGRKDSKNEDKMYHEIIALLVASFAVYVPFLILDAAFQSSIFDYNRTFGHLYGTHALFQTILVDLKLRYSVIISLVLSFISFVTSYILGYRYYKNVEAKKENKL